MDTTQEQRLRFLTSMRDALELLRADTELTADDFKYFYVIDFAAIHGYMHKTAKLPFLPIPGESPERTFARQQVALDTLFTRYPHPLLLIPPYTAELRNHIGWVKANAALAKLHTDSDAEQEMSEQLLRKLSKLIQESKEFKNFLALQRAKAIDTKLRKSALKIGKRCFPELYAAISLISVKGITTLQSLVQNNVLLDSDKVLPECSNIDYSTAATDSWYNRIYQERAHKRAESRAVQSWTDAMACTYVETANHRLNSAKKIVVFVSPSGNVETTLRKQGLHAYPPRKVGVVRDLTYCLLAFSHRNESGGDMGLIDRSLETVKSLIDIYKSKIPARLREDADEVAAKWKESENLLLMHGLSGPIDASTKPTTVQDERFLEILRLLYQAMDEKKSSIIKQVSADLDKLHQDAVALDGQIRERIQNDRVGSIQMKSSSSGKRIVFAGLQDELTIVLSFKSGDAAVLATNLLHEKAETDPDAGIAKFRTLILEGARSPSASPEHHLLAGYVLAVEGNYDLALRELAVGHDTNDSMARRELMFLSAAIHRKLYHPTAAIEFLKKALECDTNDPRVHLEYAKALWLQWRQRPGEPTPDHFLEEALKHLRMAESGPQEFLDKHLRAQIENVAAFIHTERVMSGRCTASEGLAEADRHIAEMERLLDTKEWVGRFFDTRGYWRYAKAQSLSSEKQEERKKLLKEALRDLDKALKAEEDVDMSVRRQHQHGINEALKSLTN